MSQIAPPMNERMATSIVAVVLVLLVAGVIVWTKPAEASQIVVSVTPSPTPTARVGSPVVAIVEPTPTPVSSKGYKNGTYSAKGVYVSPGGQVEIGITLAIQDGIVTDVTTSLLATDFTSRQFQEEFAGGVKAVVIGKSIDSLKLTKVAGSSLTPKGFNDALEDIKLAAKA